MTKSEEKPTPEQEAVEISAESTHVKFGDVTLCDDVVEKPSAEGTIPASHH